MNLTIDIGNTSVKCIIFNDTVPVWRGVYGKLNLKEIEKVIRKYKVGHCLISTVVKIKESTVRSIAQMVHLEILNPSTKLPVKNRYQTPETLGNDRLANVVAASFLFPGKNVLVIDAGTCIKYDFINSKKEYLGGSISPGMRMRFMALNEFTDRLPLVKEGKKRILTGKSTKEAIQSGVMTGIETEISGIIRLYKSRYKSLKIILTGGDAFRFAGELKLSIFAAAELVNLGLNEIIRFNAAKRK